MLHTIVKLNCSLTRLSHSELISICADYPELHLAPGGAEVTFCSTAGLGPTSSVQRETRSGQTNNSRAALQAPNPEVHVSDVFSSHSGLYGRAIPERIRGR